LAFILFVWYDGIVYKIKIKSMEEKENKNELNETQKNNNNQINDYLNQFKYLKTDLDELFKNKNPISFIFWVKKIFSKINDYLKEIAKFINSNISNFDNKNDKIWFLYDIWINKYQISIFKNYLFKVKYFDPEKYFEVYSRFDPNFKHFIQKIISILKNDSFNNKDIKNLLEENYYAKYTNFEKFLINSLEIIILSNPSFICKDLDNNLIIKKDIFLEIKKWLKLDRLSGYSQESAFLNNLISYYFKNTKDYNKKLEFLSDLYSIFDLSKFLENDLKYSKFLEIQNIIWFNETNDFKIDTIKDLEQKKELWIMLETYNFNYDKYIEASKIIDSLEDNEKEKNWQKRWYLWGYFKNSIKIEYFSINLINFFKNNTNIKIINKQDWIELKLDYESKIDNLDNNSLTKESSIAFMNSINDYKNLIIKLQDSIIADIIKWPILRFLYDKLTVKEDKLVFTKFLLYFASCENYYEYTKVYTFFKELEIYEKEQLENKKRIYIFDIVVFFIIWIFITYYVSFILSIWIILFYLGSKFVRDNFYSKNFYIRWHNWFRFIWILVIWFYSLNFLATNKYLSLDIKVWENTFSMGQMIDKKINNIAFFSWKDFVKSEFYISSSQAIANALQYNQKKD